MSETEFCFGAEITCGGVAFQTEAAFISICENNNFTYLSASKIIRLRYCCGSFPIKPSAFTGCSGKLSYQYVICFLQTSHDQIWQQKQIFYIRIELYFTPVLLTWAVIQEYAQVLWTHQKEHSYVFYTSFTLKGNLKLTQFSFSFNYIHENFGGQISEKAFSLLR